MGGSTSNRPTLTPKAAADKSARSERLALEMRKNLMKRKAQKREISDADDSPGVDQGETKDPV